MRTFRYFADASCLLLSLALIGCGDDSASGTDSTGSTSGSGGADASTTSSSSTGAGGEGGTYVAPPLPELHLAATPTQSTEVAPMLNRRGSHTATLLDDGTVVVIGGEDIANDRSMLATIERYDPAADAWTQLPDMPEGRLNHTATLLGDGTILVVGGGGSNDIGSPSGEGVVATALILHPDTGEIETIPGPQQPRHGHQAARLPSGKVLVVGGADDDVVMVRAEGAGGIDIPFGHPLASAELYDPVTRTFTPTGSTPEPHSSFTLVSLEDGRVLVSGGITDVEAATSSDASEVYDEATGAFASVSAFDGDDRLHAGACRLADGRALVFGGKKANVRFLGDLQAFDPATGAFDQIGEIDSARTVPNVVPTEDGGAVVVAGLRCSISGCANPPETYVMAPDGSTTEGPTLLHGRAGSTSTVLPDGSILVVGGYISGSVPYVERLTP